jgi:hypothetical protein
MHCLHEHLFFLMPRIMALSLELHPCYMSSATLHRSCHAYGTVSNIIDGLRNERCMLKPVLEVHAEA